MELKDRVAIITGGASGIGLATAKSFAAKGVKVVLSDYHEENGLKAAEELKAMGAEAIFVLTDVSKEESVKELVSRTIEHYGKLDILFNNAGVGIIAPTHELSTEEYNRIISINQHGIFYGAKYAIQEMLKTDGGVIINTSSILGEAGQAGSFAYNASKGAVNLMTKSLAVEYAAKGIRVNAVAPGYVETAMVNKESLGDFYDGLVAKHPIGRLGEPEEIAHAVVFLCENEFVTGTTIMVDGGYTAL